METVTVQCPWCREVGELNLSPEDEGSLVEDCQVCCRPWQVWVERGLDDAAPPRVHIERG